MKNPVPYLRQRSDLYWEIVFEDPKTGKTRRKATGTKGQAEAENWLEDFKPTMGADAPDPDAPRLRRRKDGYWETVWTEDGKTRRNSHDTKVETKANTLAFLDQVVEEMPFSIQRIQTDRGQEFFAYRVQEKLRDWRIEFRPIRPRSPHLNGKVERVQKTALEEFWPTVDLGDPELDRLLAEWQHFCNWERPHDSLGGLAPLDRVCERIHDVPLGEEIEAAYDLDREFTAPREAWPWRRPN